MKDGDRKEGDIESGRQSRNHILGSALAPPRSFLFPIFLSPHLSVSFF